MACLRRKANNPVWQIQWNEKIDGVWRSRSRSTGTTDYAEAQRRLKIFNDAQAGRLSEDQTRSLFRAVGIEAVRENPDLTQLWQWYLSHCDVSGAEAQRRDRENALNRFIKWLDDAHPEIRRIREVTLRICSEYWKHLENEGKSASTRNNNLSALNVIWSCVHAPMELDSNPWAAIKRDQGGSIRYQPFTLEELEALRRVAAIFRTAVEPDFWPAAIEAGLYTGLRLGDIATLDWTELSVDENFLILVPNKTKHWDEDRVAVHSLSLPWVQLLPERRPDGLLWPIAADCYSNGKLSREFTEMAKAAGIVLDREPEEGERRLMNVRLKCFHSLRHTYATIALKRGITQEELRDQGNWSGTEVIDAHYNHAKLELAKKAASRVAEVMREDI